MSCCCKIISELNVADISINRSFDTECFVLRGKRSQTTGSRQFQKENRIFRSFNNKDCFIYFRSLKVNTVLRLLTLDTFKGNLSQSTTVTKQERQKLPPTLFVWTTLSVMLSREFSGRLCNSLRTFTTNNKSLQVIVVRNVLLQIVWSVWPSYKSVT